MSMIGLNYSFATLSHFSISKQSGSENKFDNCLKQADKTAKSTGSEYLSELLSDLKELKQQQVHMSPREYLSASLTLKERISSVRLNAGEQLDVFGVKFEGQVFQLAARVYGPGTLNAIQDLKVGEIDLSGWEPSIDIKI